MRKMILAACSAALSIAGCGGADTQVQGVTTSTTAGTPSVTAQVSAPSITSVAPQSAAVGAQTVTLTVNGANFVPESLVQWNSVPLKTTFVSTTQLTATIPSAQLAGGAASIAVQNPSSQGGSSTAAAQAAADPEPTITSVSPATVTQDGPAFTLDLTGTNFTSNSIVQWNGNVRASTYTSPTSMTAAIEASDITATGLAAVTLVTPITGGGSSIAVAFVRIESDAPPVPAISALSPSAVTAAGPAFTLTVSGANFTSASVVTWAGSAVPTTYVNPTQLTAQIPAGDIATAGSVAVGVLNPPPSGASPTVALAVTGTPPANELFVSPGGSDSNPGTIGQPFLTIQKCATSAPSGGTCEVRAGDYAETVTPNSGITITAYNGESVTVDGTDPVVGWQNYQGSIYSATATMSGGDTNQVFVGGVMMTEARWPNGGDLLHVNWATLQSGSSSSQIVDSNLPNIDWTGAHVHFWSGSDPWSHQTGVVTASQNGQLSFTADGAAYCPYICVQSGGYYYLFGVLGALDSAGEWYYDPTASKLYLWAPGGVNPDTAAVRVKQRPYGFDLSGRSNVTIQNINLFATSINTDSSSLNNTINAINAQYVSHYTTLPDYAGAQSSWYYHNLDSGIVLNGTGNVLENSTIAYSAGNGVSVLGSQNTISNNLIHHVDYMGNYTAGVGIAGSGQEIQNNTIYASGRSAIFPTSSATSAEDIGYNNLYGAMMLSRDGGAIYVTYPAPAGTHIHHNWIHDTQSLVPGPADNYALSGVYLDEDASGFEVDQNVFWNDAIVTIFLNGSTFGITNPNNNNVHNNSVPDINTNSYIWMASSTIQNCGTTQIVDNLVLVPTRDTNNPPCTVSDNSAAAPGATDMTASVNVGCNFNGCASSGPPVISGSSVAASVAVPPWSVSVAAGQTATFTSAGAGSPPLAYQWQRNGVNIPGATSPTYTIPATAPSDNGATFTVVVTNGVGSATSSPATLTVN